MGYGDAILTSSIVKRAYAKVKQPLCVGDGSKVYWSPVFENNPKIAPEPYPGCFWVHDYKGHRAYIDYEKTNKLHTEYRREHRAEPGEIFLTAGERMRWECLADKKFVMIEPNIKGSYGNNKDWGFDRWQRVVDILKGEVEFVQAVGETGARMLKNVDTVQTSSFRDACAVLDRATVFAGTDGGLHHAAAALKKRAVVLWGGLVGPDVLGYVGHVNISKAKTFCGSHVACDHCKDAMNKIGIEEVANAIRAEYAA